METVLRCGAIYDPPEHDIKVGNWKYRISAMVDGCRLELVVVIDSTEEFDSQSLIIPITGYWLERGKGNGKKRDDAKAANKGAASKKIRR